MIRPVLRNIIARFLKKKISVLCLIIFTAIVLCGIFAPVLSPNDPNKVDLSHRLTHPCSQFPLGTDDMGRCVLSRLIFGTRTSLGYAFVVMLVSLVIGTFIGTFSALKGGRTDSILMRLCDIFLSFPSLVLVLVIVGVLGPGINSVMLGMIMFQWIWYVRIVRSMVLGIKSRPYIDAARVSGLSDVKIMAIHIMPNIFPQLIVLSTIDFGGLILHFSGYSFLGLGVQPPTAEWGVMIEDGRRFIRSSPELMYYPGLLITIVVIALNLMGDSLKDILDDIHL